MTATDGGRTSGPAGTLPYTTPSPREATELASGLPADAVEGALLDALGMATAEGRWSDVAALAHDLEARRRARAATVDLEAARARRHAPR